MKAKPLLHLLGATLLAVATQLAPAQAGVIFDAHGTGSTVTVPVSSTILHQTIDMSFTTTAGFPLDMGVLTALIDPTAPIPSQVFNSHFDLTSAGGNGLSGTYRLTSSVFSSPTDETFAGIFTATGGTGAYAGYVGSGTFSGTNIFADATLALAMTTMQVSGLLNVPEPSALALFGFGVAVLALGRRARRRTA